MATYDPDEINRSEGHLKRAREASARFSTGDQIFHNHMATHHSNMAAGDFASANEALQRAKRASLTSEHHAIHAAAHDAYTSKHQYKYGPTPHTGTAMKPSAAVIQRGKKGGAYTVGVSGKKHYIGKGHAK